MSITEEDFRFSRRLRKYFSLHGFPRWLRGKQTTCQCRRLRLDPWIEKIPWKREWQPTPIFLPEKFHGQRSLAGLPSMGSQTSQTQLNNLTATTTNLYKTCRLLLWTQGLSLNPRRPDVSSRLSSGCLSLSFHGSLSVDTREIFAHDLDPVYVHVCDSAGKESVCNAGDLGSIPGLGRFPWRCEQLPTPVFWAGEFHGLYSPWGRKELDTTERPSLSLFFFTCTRILSHVWLFATPWTVALQAPLSVEVSRQWYWSGLPFPTPGLHHVSRCCFSITIVEAKQTGVRWTESRKKGYCEHRTKRILSP